MISKGRNTLFYPAGLDALYGFIKLGTMNLVDLKMLKTPNSGIIRLKMTKLILIFITLFLIGCVPVVPVNQGNIILGITDEALGTISSLKIQVTSIELQNTNGQKVSLFVNKEFDLIQLNSQNLIAELGDAQVPEGVYNLVVLNIFSVNVGRNNIMQKAVLPSNALKIPISLNVEKDTISALVLDFQAEESLHLTGEGKIIMTPVIHLQEKEDVEVRRNARGLEFGRAVSEKAKTIGTDIKGIAGENKKVTKEDIDNVVVDSVGRIRIKDIPRPR